MTTTMNNHFAKFRILLVRKARLPIPSEFKELLPLPLPRVMVAMEGGTGKRRFDKSKCASLVCSGRHRFAFIPEDRGDHSPASPPALPFPVFLMLPFLPDGLSLSP